jgi:hypothetical protein
MKTKTISGITTAPAAARMVPAQGRSWEWDDDVTPELLARLQDWVEAIQRQIGAADAKASTLFGWSGTALALAVTLLVSADLSWTGLQLFAGLLGGAGVVLLGGCVVQLILAVRPQLVAIPVCGSFIGAGRLDLEDVVALAVTAGRLDPVPVAAHVIRLSQIATRKHERIRAATTFLLICLLPLAASAALTAVMS